MVDTEWYRDLKTDDLLKEEHDIANAIVAFSALACTFLLIAIAAAVKCVLDNDPTVYVFTAVSLFFASMLLLWAGMCTEMYNVVRRELRRRASLYDREGEHGNMGML